jgi:hypothetical protein
MSLIVRGALIATGVFLAILVWTALFGRPW